MPSHSRARIPLFLPPASIPPATSENEIDWCGESESDPSTRNLICRKASPISSKPYDWEISGKCRCGDILTTTARRPTRFTKGESWHASGVGKETSSVTRARLRHTGDPVVETSPCLAVLGGWRSGRRRENLGCLFACRALILHVREQQIKEPDDSSGSYNKDMTIPPANVSKPAVRTTHIWTMPHMKFRGKRSLSPCSRQSIPVKDTTSTSLITRCGWVHKLDGSPLANLTSQSGIASVHLVVIGKPD